MRLVRILSGIATYAALVLVLSTCDMANVLSTPEQRKIALQFETDSTLVMASAIRPVIQSTIDGESIVDPEIRLTSSDTTVIAISANGDSLIARKLGKATITATLVGTLLPSPLPSATDTLYVVPKEFLLDRASVTFSAIGDTLRLSATAIDGLNRAIPGLGVVWTSSDTSKVSVSPTGLVTSKANTGTPVTITAQLDGTTASADITVAQQIAHFAFVPSTIALDALGAQSTITVSGRDANNHPVPVLPTIAWTSGNAAIVSVNPATGAIVSLDTGHTYIRATATSGLATVTDTVHVEVNQQAVRVSIIAISGTSIGAIGAKLQLDGRAYDRLNTEVKKAVSWSSLDGDIAGVDANGVVTARSIGTARIVARVDTASVTQVVTVTNAAVRLALNPASATLASVNDSLNLVVTAFNALDIPIAGSAVTWSSSDSTVVKVLAPGLVRAERAGAAYITVSSGTLSAQSLVTVTNAADLVDIIPSEVTLSSVGDSIAPAVSVLNARGAPVAATSLLWSADDPAVARVTATGIIIATGSGATFIKAVNPANVTRRDSVLVNVTNAPFTLVLNDSRDTLTALGRSRTYTATVRNARGVRVLDAVVTWQSSQPTVASVVDGTVFAEGLGTTTITAQSGVASATLELTVTNDAVSLDVEPATLAIASVNDTVRLSVSARNDLGNLIPATQVTWSSTVTSVATVDASGNVASKAVGTARIIGSIGLLVDTVVVTVTNNPAAISIIPDTVYLLSIGDSIVPPAVLTNSRGATLPRTSATWSSDDPTIARVTATGVVIARDTGATIIRATSGSVSDAVVVVVSNAAAAIVLPATRDTLTAPGQTLTYAASVRNARNVAIDNPGIVWSSTNTAVATASGTSSDGTITITGFGSALIIARSGTVADTTQIFVVNQTRLYVDNGVFVSPRTGTSARPYFRIQDAVNAADPFDTVFVRKGVSAYSETVALTKRIVLLGDSTGFNKTTPNPSVLPLISHDTGSAGITAITTSPQIVRFFALRHTADGASVDARGSDIRISHLYINEGVTPPSGSGISIDNSSSGAFASVTQTRVSSVRGYGIRFVGVTNGLIRGVQVTTVDSISGTTGAGIQATSSNGVIIDSAKVRLTGGAQIHLQSLLSGTVSNSDLAGRHQLIRLISVNGSTQILKNTLNLQLQSDEPVSNGSADDGRSGLSLASSQNILIQENVFSDASALMDAIRMTGSRGSTGNRLERNQFTGGRYHVRSNTSTWSSVGMRSTGAVQAILGESIDTVSMTSDTVSNTATGCVNIQGSASSISLFLANLSVCASASAATTMLPALRVTGTGSRVQMDSTFVSGGNTLGVEHGGGGVLSVTRSVMTVTAARTLSATGVNGVIATTGASSMTVTGNRIRGYVDVAGLHVPTGVTATVSSNHFSRNKVGMRVAAGGIVTASDNDWFDNDSAGVAYAGATASLSNNFWGDGRGVKGGLDPMATGDSALGTAAPLTFESSPTFSGTVAAALRAVRGQTVSTPAKPAATVRVVDANGSPVAGVAVSFSCATNCGSGPQSSRVIFENSPTFSAVALGGTTATVTTNAAGLAEVLVDLRFSGTTSKTSTITASATGAGSASISVTVNP